MDIRYMAAAGYDLFPCERVAPCPEVPDCVDYGTIELESGWQLVSIPVDFGYWDNTLHRHIHDGITVAKFKNYVLDQITDLHGAVIVEVANTYTGDVQAFYSYVVGSTPDSSPHNFQLVYDDGLSKEITGFWIKVTGLSAPYMISWGAE